MVTRPDHDAAAFEPVPTGLSLLGDELFVNVGEPGSAGWARVDRTPCGLQSDAQLVERLRSQTHVERSRLLHGPGHDVDELQGPASAMAAAAGARTAMIFTRCLLSRAAMSSIVSMMSKQASAPSRAATGT